MEETMKTNMRIFKQQKMWRDNIITMLEQQGSRIHWRHLDDAEYDQQLRIKLMEEADEVRCAQSQNALIEELADLYEVIDCLCQAHGFTREEIIALQTKKRDERGSFSRRIFVETAEHPAGSFGEKYCLMTPEKYPEII